MTNSDTQKKIKKKAMLEALEKTLGIVTPACNLADISRQTHYRWLEEDKEYKSKVIGMEDIAIDFAESNLHKQIKNGVPSSTIFYLKTKAKKRGYVERQEVDHSSSDGSMKPTIIELVAKSDKSTD